MKTWYSCKVKYAKEQENGMLKQVTEAYLIDAVSYTDAESRIYEAMEREIAREFAVTQITKTNIAEVISHDDSENWYKCKITYKTVDGDTEKEVKINTYHLVCADHIRQSVERVEEFLQSMLVPYEIPSVTLTRIIDVFPYEREEIPGNLKPLSEVIEKE